MLKLMTHPEPHNFTFDAVAAEDVDQEGIFQGLTCHHNLSAGHGLGHAILAWCHSAYADVNNHIDPAQAT